MKDSGWLVVYQLLSLLVRSRLEALGVPANERKGQPRSGSEW